MPVERLKNTATTVELNIYKGRPQANFATNRPNVPSIRYYSRIRVARWTSKSPIRPQPRRVSCWRQ